MVNRLLLKNDFFLTLAFLVIVIKNCNVIIQLLLQKVTMKKRRYLLSLSCTFISNKNNGSWSVGGSHAGTITR